MFLFQRSSLSYAKIVQSERKECLYSFPRSSLSYAKLLINICSHAQSKQLLTYKWLVLFSLFMLLFYDSDSLLHFFWGMCDEEKLVKHRIFFHVCGWNCYTKYDIECSIRKYRIKKTLHLLTCLCLRELFVVWEWCQNSSNDNFCIMSCVAGFYVFCRIKACCWISKVWKLRSFVSGWYIVCFFVCVFLLTFVMLLLRTLIIGSCDAKVCF